MTFICSESLLYAKEYIHQFTHHVKINIYTDKNGREPFNEWLRVQDTKIRYRIRNKIDRIEEYGIFGDYKRINQLIYELKFHFGAGYRVYFSLINQQEILILCGGDKSTQQRDIEKAKQYLESYHDRYQTIH